MGSASSKPPRQLARPSKAAMGNAISSVQAAWGKVGTPKAPGIHAVAVCMPRASGAEVLTLNMDQLPA
jgi:hypothetical protein